MNKLSELSKPYGYEYVTAGRGHVVMSRTLPPVDMREVKPLYSQEYVSALLSQIEADSEIKARLCRESNSLHDRLKAAERRIAELDQKLATPVRLPEPYQTSCGANELYLCPVEVADSIRAAGFLFTVEGGE